MTSEWKAFKGKLATSEARRLRKILVRRLVAFGLSGVQAAQLLDVSTSTVNNYVNDDQVEDAGQVFGLAILEGAGDRVESPGELDAMVDQALESFGLDFALGRRQAAEGRKVGSGTSRKAIPVSQAD